MIDGVKIWVSTEIAQRSLRATQEIRWTQNGANPGGSPKYRGSWRGWLFDGDDKRCWQFRGSFHKFSQGTTNHRDFGLPELQAAVEELCEALLLHPCVLKLRNVEIGVNIRPPGETSEILGSLVHHKLASPRRTDSGVCVVHNGYSVKIYDKAKQLGLQEPLLRFEVRAKKMREVATLGIATVSDLLDPKAWQGMEVLLLKKFDEILLAPQREVPLHLSKAKRKLLHYAPQISYWQNLENSQRSRKRKELIKLYEELPGYDLQKRLREAIQLKIRMLTPSVTVEGFDTNETKEGELNQLGLPQERTAQIATITPRVIGGGTLSKPPEYATITPLIACGANVACRRWTWWRSRGPPVRMLLHPSGTSRTRLTVTTVETGPSYQESLRPFRRAAYIRGTYQRRVRCGPSSRKCNISRSTDRLACVCPHGRGLPSGTRASGSCIPRLAGERRRVRAHHFHHARYPDHVDAVHIGDALGFRKGQVESAAFRLHVQFISCPARGELLL